MKDPFRPWTWASTVLAFFFAAISHWKIFEGDLFWLVRAGAENLTQGHFQFVDQWSSTALQESWYNFQWLSGVLFYLVSLLGAQYFWEPTLRAGVIFLFFLLVFRWLRTLCKNPREFAACVLVFSPALYVVGIGRWQLRPDLFAIICFVALLKAISDGTLFQLKAWRLFVPLLFWANFHGGTYPIALMLTTLAVFFGTETATWRVSKKLAYLLVAGLCWFCTPIGPYVLAMVYRILLAYDPTIINNPDHWPLQLRFFFERTAAVFWPWLLATLAGTVTAWLPRPYRSEAGNYASRRFFLLGALGFTILTFAKMRARLFSLVFLLPALVALLQGVLSAPSLAVRKLRLLAVSLVALVLWGAGCYWWHLAPYPLGFGVDPQTFPVAAVAFIKILAPEKHLLHPFNWGGYLIAETPELPDAQDGREVLFAPFFVEKKAALDDTQSWADFLHRHHINVILNEPPPWVQDTRPEVRLRYEGNFPPRDWALVYLDPVAAVFLRRTEANQRAIQRYEGVGNAHR